ncbi:MAG: histidine phosphatase family protein [Trueperaceae bacterium]|nr:histidine phosphatase family protein [Trueperaceae bacterium]
MRCEKMLELWLIRHGETDWNREGRVQGRSDNALNDLGRAQARALGARLAATAFDRVYASDLSRAVETARLVFPGRAPELDARLREMAGGVLEGKTVAEMSESELRVRALRGSGRVDVRPEGGESYEDVMVRVRDWLGELPGQGRVACVTHGGVIHTVLKVAFGHVAGAPGGPTILIANASVSVVRLGAWTVVERVNDHAHLEALTLAPR